MLYSIGHSNRTFGDFVSILTTHKIDVLADVRGGKAGSRAFPHFDTENFAIQIPKYDMHYLRMPQLGGRRGKTKDANPVLNGEWRLDAFRFYADYAYYDPTFQEGLSTLLVLGSEVNVAFMCSEAVPWRCHRSIITDYLMLVYDKPVTHLITEKQTMVGLPHKHAQLFNDRVIYPKTQGVDCLVF